MINTSNKDDLEWGNKIPTPSPSNLTNGPILDHSEMGQLEAQTGQLGAQMGQLKSQMDLK